MRSAMPPRSRKLSTADLTAARLAYEAGASYRALGERFGCAMSTIRALLVAVGVTSRPEGFQPCQPQLEPAPPPRPAVEIAPDVTGRLRIPCRTAAERSPSSSWPGASRSPAVASLGCPIASAGRTGRRPALRSSWRCGDCAPPERT
jgi:hypothetical protein